MLRGIIWLTAACLAASTAAAEPARVLMFGAFHFKDAGKDLVKVTDVDIFSDENQAYLEALTSRMAAFEPTAVMLEYNPDSDAEMNERYQAYLADQFELPANEVYQMGFRIAKKAGLERVHSFDHRDTHWQPQEMMEHARNHEPEKLRAMEQTIEDITREESEARATMSLGELLARANDPARDRFNMDLYLMTNDIDAGAGWSGADAAASWWHRNFRMYALLQLQAQPGSRVIAIGGQGHTAILKNLLTIDRRLEMVDAMPYLGLD